MPDSNPVRISVLGLICSLVLIASWLYSPALAAGGQEGESQAAQPPQYLYLPLVLSSGDGCRPAYAEPPEDDPAREADALSSLNAERTARGMQALHLVPELTLSARVHSREMADGNYTGHQGPDGSRPWDRMSKACYSWLSAGEIVGWGFGGDVSRMMAAWMASEPHRRIILDGEYLDFGAGYAFNPDSEWGSYWTVDFGLRAPPQGEAQNAGRYVCEEAIQQPDGGLRIRFSSDSPC